MSAKTKLADQAARAMLALCGSRGAERLLHAGTGSRLLRSWLRLDALVHGFTRVLDRDDIRLARRPGYSFHVNIRELWGALHYFLGERLPFPPALIQALGHAKVVLDVGCNAGYWAFRARSVMPPGSVIHCFEANPALAAMLRQSAALYAEPSPVVVHEKAVAETSGGQRDFLVSSDTANTGQSSLVDHGAFRQPPRRVTVETVGLDDFCRAHKFEAIDVIKIDVEGAELLVLAGMRELLANGRVKMILLELVTGGEAHELLLHHGYKGFHVTDGEELRTADRLPAGEFTDLLFIRGDLWLPTSAHPRGD